MKNKEFNKLIDKLTIDPYFGIYTRNGLEYILEKNHSDDFLTVYLIDFDNLKSLNNRLGYKGVNNLLKEVFSELKHDFIIGRAFSGDEIFLCAEKIDVDSDIIKQVCIKYNLEFKIIWGLLNPNCDNITSFLDNLIDHLHNVDNNLINNLLKNSKYQIN